MMAPRQPCGRSPTRSTRSCWRDREGRERFDGFHGDLAVALAAVEIPRRQRLARAWTADCRTHRLWQLAEKQVKDAVAAAKNRPFGDLAQASAEGWQKLFDPDPAETAEFCAVCRRPKGKDENFRPWQGEGEGQICPECGASTNWRTSLGHGARRG